MTTPKNSFVAASPRHTDYVEMTVHADDHGARRKSTASRMSEADEHRSRFLSDTQRLLAEHPQEARESLASLDATDQKHWHLPSVDAVVKQLKTDGERGLSGADVDARLAEHGYNMLDEEPRTPLYIVFLMQFYNLIVGLLIGAAILSMFIDKVVEGTAILFIVTLNAIIATYQERNAGNALEALASLSSPQTTVIRDGQQQVVESKTLVPGDVVVLTTGDIVPADVRLMRSTDLKVNEMLLTGESEDVAKKFNAPMGKSMKKLTADNMVFSSTTVTAGNAVGLVVETGMHTRVGSIALLLKSGSSEEEKGGMCACLSKHQPKLTPLQRSLHKLGFVMGAIAISVCVLVFVVGVLRGTKNPNDPSTPVALYMIIVSVSLAVSAVPEGLPMVVTICLSSGTSDMVKKNVLVRKLAAVETLGAASVICTDKTGTLTEGKMTAVKMWGDFQEYDITGKGFVPEGGIFVNDVNQCPAAAGNVQVRATLLACVLCSNTHLKQKEEDGVTRWVPMGNSSEAPLVVAAAKAGIWEEYVAEEYKRVVEVPFSSSRKMMVTVNQVPSSGAFDILNLPAKTKYVACVKGAPNYILANCTRYCTRAGGFEPLSESQRATIMEAVDNLSSKALRVLAVAIQPLPELPFPESCDDVDEKFANLSQPLVFMGLMASIDPERDGVREAIATARRASVRTVMITGDYLKTAIAIAKNIDLLHSGSNVDEEATDCSRLRPTGEQYLPESEIDAITARTVVFARAKPEDKIEIVKSLQRQGLVSAMTGDGVNDAPALKEADIGVAMGITGTEVAKGASDMILMDDNFCSIVAAVEKGRVIYANIQKFVVFLLSTNVGEIILMFTAVASGMFLPLKPLQILILNLFSDGMPAVALSLEKGDPLIMDERPRPKQQPLIHGKLWKTLSINAMIIATGALATFMLGVYWNFGVFTTDSILAAGAGVTKKGDSQGVTCQRWGGSNEGWKVYGNCAAQYFDGKTDPVMAKFAPELLELSGADKDIRTYSEYENAEMYCRAKEKGKDTAYSCVSEGLSRAQTMTFVCITLTEVLRAYTVRSFTEPVWVGFFANKYLHAAALLSAALTAFVTNTPVIMDELFGFAPITWFQWLVSIGFAFNSVFWSEVIKAISRRSTRKRAQWETLTEGLESILVEVRTMRQQVDQLERERRG